MSDEQPIKNKKYHAFISYRHADNKESGRQWATWLHQALETYEVPTELVGKTNGRGEIIPSRIYPVFRDEQELPADADLGSSIKLALEQTNVLVVLCSPQAVASTYVAEEIDYFKKLGNSERIIAAMIDGEPNASWDSGKQELGFTATDECFPKPLQVKYDDNGLPTQAHAEPIAADFRINNDGKPEQGWTSPEAYKQHLTANTALDSDTIEQKVSDYQQQQKLMLLKIIAGILGIPLGELTQRDKEYQLAQERLRAKKLRRWVSALVILTILAIGTGGFAYIKQQEAERQTVIAEQKTIEAQAQTAEANHNYALALNEKAIQAEKEGNIEYAKLYALHTSEKAKNADPIAKSKGILFEHGNNSSQIWASNSTEHHDGKINQVVYSPNGQILASASDNGRIKLWSANKGTLLNTMVVASNDISNLAFSPNGKVLASSDGKIIRFWDVKTGERLPHALEHTSYVSSMSFSSDGKKLVSKDQHIIYLWDTGTGRQIKEILEGVKYSSSVLFSPDSQYITFVLSDSCIYLWDIEKEKLIKTQIQDSIGKITYSPDKTVFATDSWKGLMNKSVDLYNIGTESLINSFVVEASLSIADIAISPNNQIIASALSNDTIQLWNTSSGNKIKTLKGHLSRVTSIVFSPDGKTLASSSEDQRIHLWDTQTGQLLNPALGGHSELIDAIATSQDGDIFATSSHDNTVILWNAKTGQIIHQLVGHKEYVSDVVFSPNGKTIATSSYDRTIRIWNVKTGTTEKLIEEISDYPINHIFFSSDARLLGSVSRGEKVTFRDTKNWEIIKQIGEGKEVSNAMLSPNDRLIALSSDDNVYLADWDLENELSFLSLPKVAGSYNTDTIAFSHDGSILAYESGDNTVQLWNTRKNKVIFPLKHTSGIEAISFSLDGKIIATGSYDGIVRLWNTYTGELLTGLSGHTDMITDISFFAENKTLLSGSRDNKVRIWSNPIQKVQSIDLPMVENATLDFSPTSDFLAVTSFDEGIFIVDRHTHKKTHKMKHFGVFSIDFSSDGSLLVSTGLDNAVRIWNPQTGKLLNTFPIPFGGTKVKFSPNDNLVAVSLWDLEQQGSSSVILLLDTHSGEVIHPLKGHSNNIFSFVFSHDGKVLITASWDSTIRLWNTETGKQITTPFFESPSALVAMDITSDEKIFAVASPNNIYIYDFQKRKLLKTITMKMRVNALKFLSNNKYLLVGGNSGLQLWDIDIEKLLLLSHELKDIKHIEISPDNTQLVTATRKNIFIQNIEVDTNNTNNIAKFERNSHLEIKKGVSITPIQSKTNLYGQPPTKPNYPKTHPFHWLPLAEKGDANAMLQLGIIEHRDSHWEKAKEWYEKARDAGNPNAEERLRILALTKQYAEEEEETTHDSD